MILVTGGAGFIGSNFILDWLAHSEEPVINLDKLTYAGNLENLCSLEGNPRHIFVRGDIADSDLVAQLLSEHRPRAILNFAAESHVDRSIHGPEAFIQTNIVGTYRLLETARAFYKDLDGRAAACFRFPEKLIPLCIHNALAGRPLPIYGDGLQIRDWLYVRDHCSAIRRVLEAGKVGETYNVGGWNEMANISVVQSVCEILDELKPKENGSSYAAQITFVTDRPGHDRRYAIDAEKISTELGWRPEETFETGIRKTIQWYLDNPSWVANVTSGAYQSWVGQHYGSGSTTTARRISPHVDT